MEKFNSSNYREPRQKSILLLWAERPNAKLIMSSKAPALCNVSVWAVYERVHRCVCVCIHSTFASVHAGCACAIQKIYNEVRVSRMCAAERWRCFIACLCMSVYECALADVYFVSSISAAAAYKSFSFGDARIFPAVWRKLNREVNKQECNNSWCVVVCQLVYFFSGCRFVEFGTTNCAVCELGKIRIIQFTVIDPSVFRHIQLTLIMHLTVWIKKIRC